MSICCESLGSGLAARSELSPGVLTTRVLLDRVAYGCLLLYVSRCAMVTIQCQKAKSLSRQACPACFQFVTNRQRRSDR